MDSKILPICLEHGIKSECWHNQITAVVLSNSYNLFWYIEHFNDFYLAENFSKCAYYRLSCENKIYADIGRVLDYKTYKKQDNIIKFLHDKIDDDEYLSIFCASKGYIRTGMIHEFLFIGYDENGIYFYNYYKKQNKVDYITNKQFEKMYKEGMELLKNEDLSLSYLRRTHFPIMSMKLKNDINIEPDLASLSFALYDIYSDKAEIHYNKDWKIKFCHSHRVPKLITNFLNDLHEGHMGNKDEAVLCLHKFYEARSELLWKLKQLIEIYKVEIAEKHIMQLNDLCERIQKSRNVFAKIIISDYDFNTIEKLKMELNEVSRLDSCCIKNIADEIENNVRKQITNDFS